MGSNRGAARKMEDEIRDGTSTLIVSATGKVERIVKIVAVRVSRLNGDIFARVGECAEDDVLPYCALPGLKAAAGGTSQTALDKVISGELGSISQFEISVRNVEVVEILKE